MPTLVIVTGPPGAGKTTLAAPLARELGLPLFSKDSLKEILYDALPYEGGDRLAWSRKLGAATYPLLYNVLGSVLAAGGSAVVESNFDRELAAPQLLALRERHPFHPVQVVCWCAPGVLRERLVDRAASGTRHPGHDDLAVLERVMENVQRGVHTAMALGDAVIEVDTTNIGGIDRTALRERVQAAMTGHQPPPTASQQRTLSA